MQTTDQTSSTSEHAKGSLKRKIETASNIAVLIAAVLVAGYFVSLFMARSGSPEPSYEAGPGTRLALPEVYDFTAHDRTLILAIQDDCSHCEESMPFYREIALELSGGCRELGLVAVLPNTPTTAETLLSENGLDIPWVANTSLDSLGVQGTPTLLLVDQEGTLQDVWVGELSRGGEDDVLAAIDTRSTCS
jgi:hypothetical protein